MSKINELRKKYMDNPPIGYSRKDVSKMSDDELLDMDYFLNEDLEDIFGISSSSSCILDGVQFKCKNCGCTEYIPKNVVDSLDSQFGGPNFPPTFSCENVSQVLCIPLITKVLVVLFTNLIIKLYTYISNFLYVSLGCVS